MDEIRKNQLENIVNSLPENAKHIFPYLSPFESYDTFNVNSFNYVADIDNGKEMLDTFSIKGLLVKQGENYLLESDVKAYATILFEDF